MRWIDILVSSDRPNLLAETRRLCSASNVLEDPAWHPVSSVFSITRAYVNVFLHYGPSVTNVINGPNSRFM